MWSSPSKSFSTIQYNTTVKLSTAELMTVWGFSTIQYNTTVKQIQRSESVGDVSVLFNITLL